jgi:hypothetical protein
VQISGGRCAECGTWTQKSAGIELIGNRQIVSIRRWKDGALFCSVAARRKGTGLAENLAGGLYLSTDGAETWTRISSDTMFRCVDFAADAEDRNVIYLAAMDGLGHQGGVYLTADSGKTWANPPVPYDKSVENYIEGIAVAIHPQMRNVIYFLTQTHGMFLSRDSGRTWVPLGPLQSPPFKECTRIFWDPDDIKTVHIVTFDGGAWKGPDPTLAEPRL